MPCLVIFILPQHPGNSYEPLDIVEVIPRPQHPGAKMVEEPWRYGFFYIDDKTTSEVRRRLTGPVKRPNPAPDADEGDEIVLKRRRHRITTDDLPEEARYRRYRGFLHPDSVHVTWDELNLTHLHDKDEGQPQEPLDPIGP